MIPWGTSAVVVVACSEVVVISIDVDSFFLFFFLFFAIPPAYQCLSLKHNPNFNNVSLCPVQIQKTSTLLRPRPNQDAPRVKRVASLDFGLELAYSNCNSFLKSDISLLVVQWISLYNHTTLYSETLSSSF